VSQAARATFPNAGSAQRAVSWLLLPLDEFRSFSALEVFSF
jgi:hypothetical protein